MSFLGRKKPENDKQATPASDTPPMIDPNTGLPPPYDPPNPSAKPVAVEKKAGLFQRLKNYLLDSYNGLYKIVLEPSMPTRGSIAILVVGVIIGMISAYVLFPTEFTGAAPRRLSDDGTEQWALMLATGYSSSVGYDSDSVILGLQQIPNPKGVIDRLINDPNVEPRDKNALEEVRQIPGYNDLTGAVPPQDPGIIGSLMQILIPIIAIIIIAPILVLLWRLLIYPNIVAGIFDAIKRATNKEYAAEVSRQKKELETLQEQKRIKEEMAKNVVADAELGAPVMQTISIYTKGRNYDDSFAIELGPEQGNQFLGECGASIATKVNDEMQSVEFWGFDMATQATLTKIFAAPAAVNDPTLQAKLAPRVENPATDIVPATPGAKLTLNTDAIRIEGEIVTVNYNDAGGVPNSGIEKMQMKVTAWQKQGTPVGATAGNPPPIPPAQPLPDYSNMQFDPPPQMPQSSPPPAGGKSMDEYANIEFDPPPQMPQSSPPPAGGKSMDEYANMEFDPPPPMPGMNPLQPPPLQMPPGGLNPPPSKPTDDDDDDPFGGTGDFTPLR